MAKVLIFNTAREPVSLIVNGAPAGTAAGASVSALSAALAVERGGMPEPGRFGSQYPNQVQLVRPGGDARHLNLSIGHQVNPNSDLRLFLFSQYAVLIADHEETLLNLS
ncbi:MAG: hypothetical protein ABWX67_15155 [Allosphingosinicella sp.]